MSDYVYFFINRKLTKQRPKVIIIQVRVTKNPWQTDASPIEEPFSIISLRDAVGIVKGKASAITLKPADIPSKGHKIPEKCKILT